MRAVLVIKKNDNNTFKVELKLDYNGKAVPVPSIQELCRYGAVWSHNGNMYRLPQEVLPHLHALRRLETLPGRSDHVCFDGDPAVWKYFRDSKGVKVPEAGDGLIVEDEPLVHAVKLDYAPEEGITITTGYARESTSAFIASDDLPPASKNFVRIDGAYVELPAEKKSCAKEYVEEFGHTVPVQNIPEFICGPAQKLGIAAREFRSEDYQRIRVVAKEMKPEFRFSCPKRGWIDVEPRMYTSGLSFPAVRICRNETLFSRLDDYTWVRGQPQVHYQIDCVSFPSGTLHDNGVFRVPASQYAVLEKKIKAIEGKQLYDGTYSAFLSALLDFQPDEQFTLSTATERDLKQAGIKLRPYQRAGIHWLVWLAHNNLHGILADDMGLGKTLQTVLAVRHVFEQSKKTMHVLIICPKSVVCFWAREIKRCYPEISIFEYCGSAREPHLFKRKQVSVFISTYETIARDVDKINGCKFAFLILDEATKIKNPSALRTMSIKRISAERRLALTGTPVENRPRELWSIFDFLMPEHLGSMSQFEKVFEEKIMRGQSSSADQLASRIKPFLLKRIKEDVADDLPEKIHMDASCELTSEQLKLYRHLQEKRITPLLRQIRDGQSVNYTSSILPVLTWLKQLCDHPAIITGDTNTIEKRSHKFDFILQRLEVAKSYGEKSVVFTHFLGALDLLERALRNRGMSWVRIDGATKDRQTLIDKFNHGDVNVAICSLLSAGYGINLTAANHVIHLDRWWNPAVEDQATDRVHRIGQEKTVYVHRIIVRKTIEERIDKLLTRKREISDSIVGKATSRQRQWSREELLELLKPI